MSDQSRVIQGVVPPSGWHFIGNDGVRIDAWCLDELYNAVSHYRIENSLAVGNVHYDVDHYICSNFPRQCHPGFVLFSDVQLHPIETNPLTVLIDVASAWCRSFLHRQTPFDLIPNADAEQRTQICKDCPRNVKYEAGCPDCVAALERLAGKVRSGREVIRTKKLGVCDCHGFEASAATFLKREDLPETKPDAPEQCWMRTRLAT